MGYYNADLYNEPEKFGLEILGTLDLEYESYSFDYLVVWYHEDTERFYWGRDSGCSCPSPFEDYISMDSLTEFTTWSELGAIVDSAVGPYDASQSYYYSESEWSRKASAGASLLMTVRDKMQELSMENQIPQRTPEQDAVVAALAAPDTENVLEVDIIEAVQMLIKSVVNLGQRMALLELAMGNLQQEMAAWEDDGK